MNVAETRGVERLKALHDTRQTCPRCGSCNYEFSGINSWRWNGEHWEHRCDDLDPQIGHFRIFPDPVQKTDRELVNALIQAAYTVGRQSQQHVMFRTAKPRHQRDELANRIVELLIKRGERIKLLQATVDDLRKNEQTTFT